MRKFVVFIMLMCILSLAFAQDKDAVLGKWMNAAGEAHISIYKKNGQYFGKINKIKSPNDENGKPRTDAKNPNASLQNRPLLGLEILKNFDHTGENTYENGTIYDPKSGKTYSCKMTLTDRKLKMRGFIGVSLIGRTEIWNRVK